MKASHHVDQQCVLRLQCIHQSHYHTQSDAAAAAEFHSITLSCLPASGLTISYEFVPAGLLLARLMGQHCFAPWRLSSSVTLPAGGRVGRLVVHFQPIWRHFGKHFHAIVYFKSTFPSCK